jgi:hypothetical protein
MRPVLPACAQKINLRAVKISFERLILPRISIFSHFSRRRVRTARTVEWKR